MIDSPSESVHQATAQEHQEHHQSEATNAHSPSQLGDQNHPTSPGPIDDALAYLDTIKAKSDLEIYNNFIQIMKDFKDTEMDTPTTFHRVSTLFHEYPELIEGFRPFLPPAFGYLSSGAAHNSGWVDAGVAGEELEYIPECHLVGGGTIDTQAATTSSLIHNLPASEMPSSVGRREDGAENQIESLSSSTTGLQFLQEVCREMVGDNIIGSSSI